MLCARATNRPDCSNDVMQDFATHRSSAAVQGNEQKDDGFAGPKVGFVYPSSVELVPRFVVGVWHGRFSVCWRYSR